jgi:hypothetical protein
MVMKVIGSVWLSYERIRVVVAFGESNTMEKTRGENAMTKQNVSSNVVLNPHC